MKYDSYVRNGISLAWLLQMELFQILDTIKVFFFHENVTKFLKFIDAL